MKTHQKSKSAEDRDPRVRIDMYVVDELAEDSLTQTPNPSRQPKSSNLDQSIENQLESLVG